MEMKREAKINKYWGSEINRINYGVGVKNFEIIILNYWMFKNVPESSFFAYSNDQSSIYIPNRN